ncbi:DNA topology modulation protein [Olivibacter sp. SDN3]|uniref:DNA topology modulation protein n=1 Tax=Olivibacter sp. SDN3 TaxID=2764720 RepID=UPI0016519FC4|nr:DNA topology modulation protein [Olivibacter sp. SDN3]QNL48248.1 DNA topology modulation protein [Olivibacter sp. SDN3]
MNKVLIIGSGGAGKSTFARKLAALTQLSLIHLDAFYWQSGWEQPSRESWRQQVIELACGNQWIMDGNYGSTLEDRLRHADTVIFLDTNRYRCLWRAFKRYVQFRNKVRPDMAAGCKERITWEFIRYIWFYPTKNKPMILAKINKHTTHKKLVVLKGKADIESYLEKITTLVTSNSYSGN